MKRGSTLFLKLVICLLGAGVLSFLLWFPQAEGRAANLDLFSIYADPFILYMYLAFAPFFFALYQAFKLLGHIEQNKVFSKTSVQALSTIKYCAIAFISFIVGALSYIFMMTRTMNGDDDPAGFFALGIVVIFASTVIATGAAVAQRLLQNAVDIKAENDLTV